MLRGTGRVGPYCRRKASFRISGKPDRGWAVGARTQGDCENSSNCPEHTQAPGPAENKSLLTRVKKLIKTKVVN